MLLKEKARLRGLVSPDLLGCISCELVMALPAIHTVWLSQHLQGEVATLKFAAKLISRFLTDPVVDLGSKSWA